MRHELRVASTLAPAVAVVIAAAVWVIAAEPGSEPEPVAEPDVDIVNLDLPDQALLREIESMILNAPTTTLPPPDHYFEQIEIEILLYLTGPIEISEVSRYTMDTFDTVCDMLAHSTADEVKAALDEFWTERMGVGWNTDAMVDWLIIRDCPLSDRWAPLIDRSQ